MLAIELRQSLRLGLVQFAVIKSAEWSINVRGQNQMIIILVQGFFFCHRGTTSNIIIVILLDDGRRLDELQVHISQETAYVCFNPEGN